MATNPLQNIKDSFLGQSGNFFNGNNTNLPIDGKSYAPSIQVGNVPSPVSDVLKVGNVPAPVNTPTAKPTPQPAIPTPTTGVVDRSAMKVQSDEILKKALAIQEELKTIRASELARSSATPVQNEKDTKKLVESLGPVQPMQTAGNTMPANPSASVNAKAYDTSYLDNYFNQLDQRRASMEQSINNQFDSTKQATQQAQTKESGTFNTQLARIGGYLGGSASATGAMLNLAETHRNELASLEVKRANALQEARNAVDDKQFAVAQAKAQEIRDLDKEAYKRQQDFFDNAIKLGQNEREQDKFAYTQAKDEMELLKDAAPESIPEETLQRLDSIFGIPGITKASIDLTRQANAIKSDKDRISYAKDVMTLLKDIPAGQTIPINGVEYTGIGSAGDIQVIQETDNNGNVHMITYDKANRQIVGMQTLAGIGKTSTEGGGRFTKTELESVKQEVVARTQAALEEQARTETGDTRQRDGKTRDYDPDIFLQKYQDAQDLDPAAATELYKKFIYDDSAPDDSKDRASNLFSNEAINRMAQKGLNIPPEILSGTVTKK